MLGSSRRWFIKTAASFAVLPTSSLHAYGLSEQCRAENTSGSTLGVGTVYNQTHTDGQKTERADFIVVRHKKPYFTLGFRIDVPGGGNKNRIDFSKLSIAPEAVEFAKLRAKTQPIIDWAKADKAPAQGRNKALKLQRQGKLVFRNAKTQDTVELQFLIMHSFERWEDLNTSKGLEFREGETFSVTERSTEAQKKQAFRMLFSSDPIEVTTFIQDSKTTDWSLIEQGNVDSKQLRKVVINIEGQLNKKRETLRDTQCNPPKGCFLTTTCCAYMGRSDDCFELRTLRAFRDGWLSAQPNGRALIDEYYRTAPTLCHAIEDDEKTLRWLYWGTILPCVAAIRLGAHNVAFHLYKRMIRNLRAAHPDVV